MALLLRQVRRSARGVRACHRSVVPPPQGPCVAPPQPPCPPCESEPAPPCRAKSSETRTAVRIVCCPPPAGCRPPCVTPPPACTRTCENRLPKKTGKKPCIGPIEPFPSDGKCGFATDIVTARLLAAAAARRKSYELEVQEAAASSLTASPSSPGNQTYRLRGEERSITLATDGHDYSMPCAPGPPPSCGPCRQRPPVELLELPQTAPCQTRRGLDPCGHRPRVVVSIDRSTDPKILAASIDSAAAKPPCPTGLCGKRPTAPLSLTHAPSSTPTARPAPPAAPGLTARIIKSLSLGRSTGGSGKQKSSAGSCSRPSCPPAASCRQKAGRARAGDDSWCTNKPQPQPPPKECREPTLAERMRWRPAGSPCERGPCAPCGRPGGGGSERRLHTSAAVTKAVVEKATPKATLESIQQDKNKLEAALKERASMQGVARGRELPCGKPPVAAPLPPPTPSPRKLRGVMQLELEVVNNVLPPSLPAASGLKPSGCSRGAPQENVKSAGSSSKVQMEKEDSYWSIKSLQKKFSGKKLKSPCGSATPTSARPPCKDKAPPACPPQPCPPYRPYGAPDPDPCAPKVNKAPSSPTFKSPCAKPNSGKIKSTSILPLLIATT